MNEEFGGGQGIKRNWELEEESEWGIESVFVDWVRVERVTVTDW